MIITTISHGRFVMILLYRGENESLDQISRQHISRSGSTDAKFCDLRTSECTTVFLFYLFIFFHDCLNGSPRIRDLADTFIEGHCSRGW